MKKPSSLFFSCTKCYKMFFFICGSSRKYIFAFPLFPVSIQSRSSKIIGKHTKNSFGWHQTSLGKKLFRTLSLSSRSKKLDFLAVSNPRFLGVEDTLRVVGGIHLLVQLVGDNLHHLVHKHWYYIPKKYLRKI